MSDDMPEEIYVRKVTEKTLSAIRPESPILLGCLDGKLMRTKYIRADLVPQWHKIDTAPKDGTNFLFCTSGGHIGRGHFARHRLALGHKNGFRALDGFFAEPTHWMPLPQPPTEKNDE